MELVLAMVIIFMCLCALTLLIILLQFSKIEVLKSNLDKREYELEKLTKKNHMLTSRYKELHFKYKELLDQTETKQQLISTPFDLVSGLMEGTYDINEQEL